MGRDSGGKKQHDAASRARGKTNESETFQGEDHLMHGESGDLEISLEISLCRRPAIELSVCVKESEVLALRRGGDRQGVEGWGIYGISNAAAFCGRQSRGRAERGAAWECAKT